MTWQLDNSEEVDFNIKLHVFSNRDQRTQVKCIDTALQTLLELNNEVALTKVHRARLERSISMLKSCISVAK